MLFEVLVNFLSSSLLTYNILAPGNSKLFRKLKSIQAPPVWSFTLLLSCSILPVNHLPLLLYPSETCLSATTDVVSTFSLFDSVL